MFQVICNGREWMLLGYINNNNNNRWLLYNANLFTKQKHTINGNTRWHTCVDGDRENTWRLRVPMSQLRGDRCKSMSDQFQRNGTARRHPKSTDHSWSRPPPWLNSEITCAWVLCCGTVPVTRGRRYKETLRVGPNTTMTVVLGGLAQQNVIPCRD